MSALSKILFFILIITGASAPSVFGRETRYLYRSPKALLMGDAYTAMAYDEYTLFYNPATLGRGSLVEIYPINPEIGVTNALAEMDRFKDFPKDAVPIADRILGFPVYVHAGAAPGLKFGSFGFSMFASSTTSLVLQNAIYPQLDIDYRLDRGFIAGYAYSWGTGGKMEKFNPFDRSKKKLSMGYRTSIGGAVKHINRQGLAGSYSLFGTTLLNEINSQEKTSVDSIRRSLGFAKGDAWGADVGVEHIVSSGKSELAFAASVMDVGGTDFKKSEGTGEIPDQDMHVNVGTAWRQDFGLLDYSLSFDMHPINQPIALGRMAHFGFELGLPIVRVMAGWNEGYITYGVMANLWLVKLMVGFYDVELGSNFKEEQGKRALLYLSLLDFTFDL
ncbi:MAG: hypothetical protein A2X86_07715 [Bdellovibrionales bacterium GWA2_49_15]|nr:MAG: hypothetical protein A2X86_07715 [Bdellovibrionales bacterium GWA2_49_15]HAZ11835.1 hypothetical protein [Bdellovibrionales bacterium]